MKYQFVKENHSAFSMKKMCHVLQVSMSGFYSWQKRVPSVRKENNERLQRRIFELYIEHNRMAGSPMITADLHDEDEFSKVSKNRVARLMNKTNLKCKTLKKFIATTDSRHNKPKDSNNRILCRL